MKKIIIYTYCFLALAACKKSERLQKDETIVNGTVTEVQRGVPIEGATVVLQEFLEDGNSKICDGSCLHLLDSVLTDANGYYEFKLKAKKGTKWRYSVTCRKENYLATGAAIDLYRLTKEKVNIADLSLLATGTINLTSYRSSLDTSLVIASFGIEGLSSKEQTSICNSISRSSKCTIQTTKLEAGKTYILDFRIKKITNFQTNEGYLYSSVLKEYYLSPNSLLIDTLTY